MTPKERAESFNKLVRVIRVRADKVSAKIDPDEDFDSWLYDRDTAQLLRCLARLLEGRDVYRAFGAPGDWPRDICAALREAYERELRKAPVQ